MTKKMEVDVEASLGFQENGRLKPTKKQEYAELSVKQFVCPQCSRVIEIEKKSFGEEILCPDCGERMVHNI